jgi:hypothetical protein
MTGVDDQEGPLMSYTYTPGAVGVFRRPVDAEQLSPPQLRCLLTLVRLHQTYGRTTMRAVAHATGRNVSTTYQHLCRLRDQG